MQFRLPDATTEQQLQSCRDIRVTVFVEEQGVPLEDEFDQWGTLRAEEVGREQTARKITSIRFRSAFLRNASQFAVSLGKRDWNFIMRFSKFKGVLN